MHAMPNPDDVSRASEDSYRAAWTWDDVRYGTHCVDCYPGNCPYRVYIKDGKVIREEVSADLLPTGAGIPDMNPMGCNKGAAWSHQLTNPDRLTHPLRRVGERGSGRWEQITWDEALTELADSIIDAIESQGPASVLHEGTPEMTTVAPTHRFMAQIGGTVTDFNATTNDFNVGMHITFGKYGIVSSVDDWFNSELILVWFLNPAYTRIPHAHFIWEARYKGAEVIQIAPDYNASAMHADTFIPIGLGTDAALALSISQVLLAEELIDEGFVASQTDLSLLIRLDNHRFLRACDLDETASDDQFLQWDSATDALREADRGALLAGDSRPALNGRHEIRLADGSRIEAVPALQLLQEHLDARYSPEIASKICGVSPSTIRSLARKIASKKTNILFGAAASKYYHGDLIERSLCLPLALTGNWGKKGTGIRAWSAGMFDGSGIAMAKQIPGAQGAELIIQALEAMVAVSQAADPTMSRELAGLKLARMQSSMVPPFFFWYYHGGYADRWAREGWNDPSMPRPLADYVEEAIDAGWWDGLIPLGPETSPRVLIECGGNMLRRTRGGKGLVLENLWPMLDKVAVIDTRMTATAQFADLVLPAANHYEKIDFHIPTPHVMNLTFSDKSQDPEGEALTEWEIFTALAESIAARAADRGLESFKDTGGMTRRYADLPNSYTLGGHFVDAEVRADEMLRDSTLTGTLPPGTDLATMREKGHVRFTGWGVLPYGWSQGSPFPDDGVLTPLRSHVEFGDPYPTLTRRAQFYIDHPWFLEAGEGFPCHKDAPPMGGDYPFMLTSGHCRWSVHRMNIANSALLQTHRGEPHAAISLADSRRLGISDHDEIEVFNDSGAFIVRARVQPSVMPGQLIVYNGWESFQFRGWKASNEVEGGMVKWLHLAGGYGHLDYAPTGWQPSTVDRGTRVGVKLRSGDTQ